MLRAICLLVALATGTALAAQQLTETFDSLAVGTAGVPTGWTQNNLSNPVGSFPSWFGGNNVFAPHAGANHIAVNFNSGGSSPCTISNWLISPAVQLQNGQQITFYTRVATGGGVFPDRMQVRLNPSNTTNVGASATSVGDFTILALDINPTYSTTAYPEVWTLQTITVSGITGTVTGRVAFRYFVEDGGPSGANSNYVGIDELVIGDLPVTTTPVVTVSSSGSPSEPSTNGTFTFTATPAPLGTINVTITVTGTATNGTDYQTISTTVPITSSGTATVALTVIDDSTVETGGETVILTVVAGTGYTVGTPDSAQLTIADDDSGGGGGLSITTTALPNGTVGVAYSF
ncbi:MAG: choice-of-anchor J domain-containing protein, partial [Planctomycetes bacterium]|nr:choice-of-anchor J domain-containing protein [Planctomycetota bacterium]